MNIPQKIIIPTLAFVLFAGCGGNHKPANPSGSLEATEVEIAATFGGRLVRVAPQLGDNVNAGDTLLLLDTDLIFLQRAQAEAGRGSLAAQKKVAEESLSQAGSNMAFLTTTRDRTAALVQQGSATQSALDEVQTKLDVAGHQRDAAQDQLQIIAAEDTRLSASLAVFDRQLKEGVVLSPVSGTVILRAVEPGEVVLPGAVCLKVADLSRLELRIYLAATELDRAKIGQHLPVLVDALGGEKLDGEIIWISSESEFTPKNAQTRDARTQLVFAVKLRLANPDGRLHIGMPAEAIIN